MTTAQSSVHLTPSRQLFPTLANSRVPISTSVQPCIITVITNPLLFQCHKVFWFVCRRPVSSPRFCCQSGGRRSLRSSRNRGRAKWCPVQCYRTWTYCWHWRFGSFISEGKSKTRRNSCGSRRCHWRYCKCRCIPIQRCGCLYHWSGSTSWWGYMAHALIFGSVPFSCPWTSKRYETGKVEDVISYAQSSFATSHHLLIPHVDHMTKIALWTTNVLVSRILLGDDASSY